MPFKNCDGITKQLEELNMPFTGLEYHDSNEIRREVSL